MSAPQLDRRPPQDVEAEMGLLGGILLSADALADCRDLISDDDFYRPAHAAIWQAACKLHNQGEPVDAITVAAVLLERGQIARIGGHVYLHTLIESVPTAANAGYYAQIVADKAILRHLAEAGTRIAQMAYGADRGEGFVGTVADVLERAEEEMRIAVRMSVKGKLLEGLHRWVDFIFKHGGEERDWIVKELIARQDVIMVLAPPGAGKTTLSRQMCLAIAAGIHPFILAERIKPMTTLLIDLEVDPSTAADETEPVLGQVRRFGDLDDSRAWIWSHIEGLNLRKPADARQLESVIAEVKPDFVAIGSLYKTGVQAKGGESYEVAANEVRDVFDRLRRRYNFALWIEHHMPKGQDGGRKKNPFGSSVWEWWPSHGRVLERTSENLAAPFSFAPTFRGDRGKRAYPVGFTRGGLLPFSPVWEESELQKLTEAAQ